MREYLDDQAKPKHTELFLTHRHFQPSDYITNLKELIRG